jgi:hypothetical protein
LVDGEAHNLYSYCLGFVRMWKSIGPNR